MPATTTHTGSIVIRPAHADDRIAVERVAALDSSRVPTGDLLLAELDDRTVAAISLADGRVIANPFVPTADVIALLRVRAGRQVKSAERPIRFPIGPLAANLGRSRAKDHVTRSIAA